MIRRTPQEIADFFGCYMAMDKDGNWYSYDREPTIGSKGAWNGPVHANFMNDLVKVDHPANWEESLVAPQSKDAIEVFKSIQKHKHHASEVYIETGYIILSHENQTDMEALVNEYMADGWMPIGGICMNDSGFFQAMTRGIE